MTLLSPLALLLLLPWAVACVWGGRRVVERRGVPFVRLWPKTDAVAGPRRRRPPVWFVLLLLAALLTILAAAAPVVRRPADAVTILIDRRPSMTSERFKAAVARLGLWPTTRVRVVPVPGGPFDAVGFIDQSRVPPTALAIDDDALLAALRRQAGPAVLLTDRPIAAPPGVTVVTPGRPLDNAGIDLFATTLNAKAVGGQALVRVFNGTSRTRAMVDVNGIRRPAALPPPGESADVFIDLPTLPETLTATLLTEAGQPWRDDVAGDDAAYLVAAATAARFEPQTTVSPALAKMLAVYARHRPTAADAPVIAIVRAAGLKASPCVVLPDDIAGSAAAAITLDATHAVSRSLDARRLVGRPSPARPPGDGWRALAREGETVLLAVRDSPARQVWAGFDADAMAAEPAFVAFWADAFDWLAGGTPAWTARPAAEAAGGEPVIVTDANLESSPGLYRDAAGRTFATRMPAVRPTADAAGSPAADAAVVRRAVEIVSPISPYLLGVAMMLTAASLLATRLDRVRTDP